MRFIYIRIIILTYIIIERGRWLQSIVHTLFCSNNFVIIISEEKKRKIKIFTSKLRFS